MLGSRANVVNAVANRLAFLQSIPTDSRGVYNVFISVGGTTVQVTGRIIDGTIYISNFWVPPPL